jgi:4-hydroxybenzoate polyprenyltransferase
MRLSSLCTGLIDLLFLSRPMLLAPVWGFAALGYWRAQWYGGDFALDAAWEWSALAAFVWIAVFSFSVAAVYVMNQIADREVDALNGGFALMVHGRVRKEAAWAAAAGFAALALVPSALWAPELLPYCIASLALGIAYSFKPAFFSGRPGLDFLANAAGYGLIAFGAGWTLGGGQITIWFLRGAAPYFFLMCAGSISSTLPDRQGDLACGKHTTAVVCGERMAHLLAMLFLGLAAAAGYLGGDHCAVAAAALTFPFYIAYALLESRLWMEATYKIGGGILMLIAALVFPALIAPAALTVAAVRLYFRYRHNARYPALVPQ